MLCSNRPEGFGPHSALSSPLPTSCFTDTILIPLPIYLSLILLPLLLLLSHHHRRSSNFNPSTAHLRSSKTSNCGFNTLSTIYYILIICNILMEVLETVRLSLLHYGIALLPFVWVGLLLAAYLHWSEGLQGRIRGWQIINAVIWVGGIVMCVVKVVGLSNEGIHKRKGSKYPVADQVTDVATMAGVYAVIAGLEVALGFWRALRRARAEREEDVGSGAGNGVDGEERLGMGNGMGMGSGVAERERWDHVGKYERKGTL